MSFANIFAASIQTVESFAVCTQCSRLSTNVHECDACGNALSENNTTSGYTSDPTADTSQPTQVTPTTASTSPTVTPASTVGTPTPCLSVTSSRGPHTTAQVARTSIMDGPPQPVPQALYVNNSALPSLNLHQQPSFITSASLAAQTQAAPASVALSGISNGRPLVNNHPAPPLPTLPPGLGLRPTATVQPGPPPALVPVSTATRSLVNNNSYPPPYQEAVTRRPPPPQPPARPSPAPSVTNTGEGMRVSLEAHQIRVGTRKFMPASNVVFKEDGVLFTLREYTHAPLLLNARAIIKCKANLNSVHPVLFFALEQSCVKQIRSIFHMSEDEFNDKDVLEKKRCITVFPKNLTTEEANAINQSFNSMKAKFGRVDSIVFPIDMDVAIDIIYGSGERPAALPNTSSAPSRQTTTNGVTSSQSRAHHPYQRPQIPQQQQPQQHQQQHHLQRPMATHQQQQAQQQQQRMQNNLLTSSLQANNMMLQSLSRPQMQAQAGLRMAPPPNIGPPRMAGNQPITIPQDPASFALLSKTLQANMIYQVVQPNDRSRIIPCIWTGSTFQPCPMDEIRLQCKRVRVGSLCCASDEPVIIKPHGTRLCITFKMKVGNEPACAFPVYEDELQHCFVCFQNIHALFLFPNATFAQRIRYQLKMKSSTKDPTFDNNSKEERQRHLILFLGNISAQARDDLLKLKRMVGQRDKPLISELDNMGALKILAAIKSNTPPQQSKITEYGTTGVRFMAANGSQSVTSLEALALEIATQDLGSLQQETPDDDDDDLIMTSEELTVKCPYTQQVMKEPYRNKNCSHNYEREAILEFIRRRRAKGTDKTAKCPYAGCGNQVPLTLEDLEENLELKEYIRRKTASATSGAGSNSTTAS